MFFRQYSRHLEANRERPAVGVVDGEGDRLRDGPLVPHLLPVVDAPEVQLYLVPAADANRRRHREEDREPAEHP